MNSEDRVVGFVFGLVRGLAGIAREPQSGTWNNVYNNVFFFFKKKRLY